MVRILDTTLREGEQAPGVYFNEHVKLAIARRLASIGVDFIEAGHPGVSKEISVAVRLIANSGLQACIGAHSRSLRHDVDLALECGTQFIGVFYCVSESRLSGVFKQDVNQAIDQISDVISYAKTQKPNLLIRYTPEDTVRSPFGNVIAASVAAVRAGADIISIADTTGYMVPGTDNNLFDYVTSIRRSFEDKGIHPRLAVHCHNDRGLALANAVDAYRAGVDIIDASVMGLGERAGIVDLAQLLAVLTTNFDESRWELSELDELYHLVSRHSGIGLPDHFPVTGKHAFTHCAGVHTHAALQDPLHYESLSPKLFGRTTSIALDHMSGLASVKYALQKINRPEYLAEPALARLKDIGRQGRAVDLDEFELIADSIEADCSQRKVIS